MNPKLTYTLGAGACFQALTLNKDLFERMEIFFQALKEIIKKDIIQTIAIQQ